ncbi:MAG: hypothetical protein JWO06_1896 [Bacteroidota bacterium]|nr:hypothetical protein [Bacteroidota bacterium]
MKKKLFPFFFLLYLSSCIKTEDAAPNCIGANSFKLEAISISNLSKRFENSTYFYYELELVSGPNKLYIYLQAKPSSAQYFATATDPFTLPPNQCAIQFSGPTGSYSTVDGGSVYVTPSKGGLNFIFCNIPLTSSSDYVMHSASGNLTNL